MALEIGYNVKKAEELMKSLEKSYKEIKVYTQDEWETLYKVMRDNWVGEDEQDFEQQFVRRICKLYVDAANLVKSAVETVGGLANVWIEFQNKNTITGEAAEGKVKGKVDIPTIKPEDNIIKYKSFSISENTDRGLKTATSGAAIQKAMSTYVDTIKNKIANLFAEINASTAFFGNQTSSLDKYVEQTRASVTDVILAVKDMYENINVLANTSYSSAMESVTSQIDSASSSMSEATGNISKWG